MILIKYYINNELIQLEISSFYIKNNNYKMNKIKNM